MNRALCNILACFILKKESRHRFRKKYGSPKNNGDKISSVERLLRMTIDITKLPPAKGNLKMIQDCSVALLNHFNEICKKHNIPYWIDSGTLIGYVRHNGFIPWDDDIDICMMRKDYEKLFQILDAEFVKDGFKYTHGEITRLYYKNTPAQVDIFPIDIGFQKLPPKGKEKDEFISVLNEIKSSVKCDYKTNIPLQQPVCSLTDVYNALKSKDKLFKSRKEVEDGFLFYGIEAQVKNRCLFEQSDAFPLKKVSFLGIDTHVPQNTDYWLFGLYGDYMVLPDDIYQKHKEITHRLSDESFKNCQELIKNYYPKVKHED